MRHRLRAGLMVLVCALLTLTTAAPSLAATVKPRDIAGPQVDGFIVYGHLTNVTSTTGVHLQASTAAFINEPNDACSSDPDPDYQSSLEVGLRQDSSSATEEHVWTFTISCTDLTQNSDGSFTLTVPPAELGAFSSGGGGLTLTATPTGDFYNQCDGDQSEEGSLSGNFGFDTGSASKWGSVGSSDFSFDSATLSDVESLNQDTCHSPESLPPCGKTFYQYDFDAPPGYAMFGNEFAPNKSLMAGDLVYLEDPTAVVNRYDMYTIDRDVPKVTVHGNQRTVTVTGTGSLASGTSILKTARKTEAGSYGACRSNGRRHHLGRRHRITSTTWSHGTLTNSARPLTFHSSVSPPLTFVGKNEHGVVVTEFTP